jgi:GrpB-like predicted nucleotidyltransferase (UPF0157 family)
MQAEDESTARDLRDAEVAHMTIGTPDQINSQIELVEYDPAWPEQYAVLERTIREALGEHVRLIEHCGSTSVPGLPAKPRIDIVLAVPNSADEDAYAPALEAKGFWLRIREPEWYEHRVFKFADPDVNLHVFTEGSREIDKMLLFRDWMRTHPDDRDLYASEKRRLAAQTWKYVQNYADAKSSVVEQILSRAGWTAE